MIKKSQFQHVEIFENGKLGYDGNLILIYEKLQKTGEIQKRAGDKAKGESVSISPFVA